MATTPSKKKSYVRGAVQRVAGARSLLGVISDEELAKRLGVSAKSVERYRQSQGIKIAPMQARLTAKQLSRVRPNKVTRFHDLVGVKVDSEVARLAGVTTGAVLQYRKTWNIPAATKARKADDVDQGPEAVQTDEPGPVVTDSPSDEADSGAEPGEQQPLVGKAERKVRKSKLDPFRHLVGVESDEEVARLAGMTVSGVKYFRRTREIAAPPGLASTTAVEQVDTEVAPEVEEPSEPAQEVHKAQDDAHLHEAAPDAPTAEAPAVEHEVIEQVEAAPEHAETPELHVWRVLGADRRIYVVAATIGEAAAKAEAAGHTVGIRRVGPCIA